VFIKDSVAMYRTAATQFYRVTDIGRTWQDVISGVGSYFSSGGRYNRIQQRTVYASADPLVSITESGFHRAVKWQMSIGRGSLGALPPLPPPTLPLVSEHWLWCFTLNTPLRLVNIDTAGARAALPDSRYELFNPSEAYRTTADLADAIRLHSNPNNPGGFVEGILAPSVRTPPAGSYRPQQHIFFVPPNQFTIQAALVTRWRLTLEFVDSNGRSITANRRDIDWEHCWFYLDQNAAAVPALRGGVAVGPEAQVDEVEHRRPAGNLLKREGVARGRGLQVGSFHGHGMHLFMAQRGMLQAFAHVGQVSTRMSRRRPTFVHLDHMHALPRDIFACQGTKHEPRSAAAADSHEEATARGRASLCGDYRRCPSGDRIGIGEDFNLHNGVSDFDWPARVSIQRERSSGLKRLRQLPCQERARRSF
jgi:hypothetical protein